MRNLKFFSAIVIILVMGVALAGCSSQVANVTGGSIHNTQESFDAGIAVGGTQVISSSRAISATTFSGTTGSFVNSTASTTVSVGSSGSGTNKGKLCVWNGSSYSIITFAANSTSTSIATSTSCSTAN